MGESGKIRRGYFYILSSHCGLPDAQFMDILPTHCVVNYFRTLHSICFFVFYIFTFKNMDHISQRKVWTSFWWGFSPRLRLADHSSNFPTASSSSLKKLSQLNFQYFAEVSAALRLSTVQSNHFHFFFNQLKIPAPKTLSDQSLVQFLKYWKRKTFFFQYFATFPSIQGLSSDH